MSVCCTLWAADLQHLFLARTLLLPWQATHALLPCEHTEGAASVCSAPACSRPRGPSNGLGCTGPAGFGTW